MSAKKESCMIMITDVMTGCLVYIKREHPLHLSILKF